MRDEWQSSRRFVIVPAPYDVQQSGADDGGPTAILEAARQLEWFNRAVRSGVVHVAAAVEPIARPERMAVRITEIIGEILFAGKVPVLLCGDHALSFGAICAALKLDLAGDLTVLQLDARPDLYEEHSCARWGRQDVTRRMAALPGVNIVQVGLRASSSAEYSAAPDNVAQFRCETIANGFPRALQDILEATGPDVYLSFDAEVCAALPTGGLSFEQARDLLIAVCSQRRVLGFDCVGLRDDDYATTARLACAAMEALEK